MAAKTLFTMIYVGAVEGRDRWLRPNQVTKMTTRQATLTTDIDREHWAIASIAPGRMKDVQGRWYEGDTREPIRDETLRNGLVLLGAVVQRAGIATTSSMPRWAVAEEFYKLLLSLFSKPQSSVKLIEAWQKMHLTPSALGRVKLMRSGSLPAAALERIKVTFPNGEVRLMHPGPSTFIAQAVLEQFAPRFLVEPSVIFLSESAEKVVTRDDELARSLGLKIDFARNLPDVILADAHSTAPKVIFVEVVATSGAITEHRKESLGQLTADAGFPSDHVYFVSAFRDRETGAFKRAVADLAWDSFVWFAAEPDKLLVFRDGSGKTFTSLLSK
jgi:hypothetical protein